MRGYLFRAFFVYLLLHIFAIFGCFSIDDCGPFKNAFYRVEQVHAVNVDKNRSTGSQLTEWPDSSNVLLDEFAIAIVLDVEYFTSAKFRFENPFITQALACSPLPPEAVEKITGIEIMSDANFVTAAGDTIPAGASLRALFEAGKSVDDNFGAKTIAEYLQSNDAVPRDNAASDFLFLTEAPANNQQHRFTVTYSLDSGSSFSTITNSIGIH